MSLTIYANASVLQTQHCMNRANQAIETSMQRLASGLRINSAKDDAAGIAIGTRMQAHIRSGTVLIKEINNGNSLVQVAESGLGHIHYMLQRGRELAVQAANGTLSDSDRAALDIEYQLILKGIDQLVNTTEVFGVYPLRPIPLPIITPPQVVAGNTPHITDIFPSSGSSVSGKPSGIQPIAYIPAGAMGVQIDINSYVQDDDIQVFTQDGKHIAGTPLTDMVWSANGVNAGNINTTVFLESSGFTASANYDDSSLLDGSFGYTAPPGYASHGTYHGMQLDYTGDGHPSGQYLERIYIDQTPEPLLILVVGEGIFDATASWTYMPPKDTGTVISPATETLYRTGPIDVPVESVYNGTLDTIRVEQTPADTATLGIANSALDPQQSAREAIGALDQAIERVSEHRATHGAVASRLESAGGQVLNTREAISVSRSRINDADYAETTAVLTRSQLLTASCTKVLAQANVNAQAVLTLLQRSVQAGAG